MAPCNQVKSGLADHLTVPLMHFSGYVKVHLVFHDCGNLRMLRSASPGNHYETPYPLRAEQVFRTKLPKESDAPLHHLGKGHLFIEFCAPTPAIAEWLR